MKACLVLLLVGLATINAAVLRYEVTDTEKKLTEIRDRIHDYLEKVPEEDRKQLNDFVERLGKGLANLYKAWKDTTDEEKDNIDAFLEKIRVGLRERVDESKVVSKEDKVRIHAIGDALHDAVQNLIKVRKDVSKEDKEKFHALVEWFGGAVKQLHEHIKHELDENREAFLHRVELRIRDHIKRLSESERKIFDEYVDKVHDAVIKVFDRVKKIPETEKKNIREFVHEIAERVLDALEHLDETYEKYQDDKEVEKLVERLGDRLKTVYEKWSEIDEADREHVITVVENVHSTLHAARETLVAMFKEDRKATVQLLGNLVLANAEHISYGVLKVLVEGFKIVEDELGEVYGNLEKAVETAKKHHDRWVKVHAAVKKIFGEDTVAKHHQLFAFVEKVLTHGKAEIENAKDVLKYVAEQLIEHSEHLADQIKRDAVEVLREHKKDLGKLLDDVIEAIEESEL